MQWVVIWPTRYKMTIVTIHLKDSVIRWSKKTYIIPKAKYSMNEIVRRLGTKRHVFLHQAGISEHHVSFFGARHLVLPEEKRSVEQFIIYYVWYKRTLFQYFLHLWGRVVYRFLFSCFWKLQIRLLMGWEFSNRIKTRIPNFEQRLRTRRLNK